MKVLAGRCLIGTVMLWLAMGDFGSAQADPVAYVAVHVYNGPNGANLFGELDLTTGVFTQISDLNTSGNAIFGMGFGANGQIYGAGSPVGPGTIPSEFYSINPTTGTASDLGSLPFEVAGAATNSSGTFYALNYIYPSQTSASLYSINPPSNSTTLIGTVPFSPDGMVAIDAHGNLFASGNEDGSFFEVNTSDASTTLIGNTGLTGLFAGTFVGSTLYGISTNQNTGVETIVTINTATGLVTSGSRDTHHRLTQSPFRFDASKVCRGWDTEVDLAQDGRAGLSSNGANNSASDKARCWLLAVSGCLRIVGFGEHDPLRVQKECLDVCSITPDSGSPPDSSRSDRISKPFPGVESRWEGFVRHDFQVDGANVTVVEPREPLPGRPWAWRGEFFGAFPNADIELLKSGWHLAYIGVPDLFGSPKAMKHWEKFYDLLVKDYGLSAKPALIGLSRGALYCMAWAATHPEKTLLVYLDNGVCDFKSWPGGKPKGLGSGQPVS